jgi:O-antigen/teichoic acid export membrane protein
MPELSVSKRIAKNTIFLYIRMILVMAVSLYTSRVILNTLGASDYGVYDVVGGVVTIMTFLSGALGASTSRFLTYDLGLGDQNKLNNTFSAALLLHIGVALLVVLFGETIGLWLLYNKLVIPDGRMTAAFWVLHASILTTGIHFVQVPFTASI